MTPMSFLCTIENKKIYSFTLNNEQWARLKSKYKKLNMHMSCCQTQAIPKKNKFGTQFFAHHHLGECSNQTAESREHQYCKFLALKYLHEHGWEAQTEYQGSTPDGQLWIADIFAQKKQLKIAVEIQWSHQTIEEIIHRQEQYIASGLHTIWFLRSSKLKKWAVLDYQSHKLPIFSFWLDKETDQFKVSGVFHDYASAALAELEFVDFLDQLMQGNIQYSIQSKAQYYVQLGLSNVKCWRCNRSVNLITALNLFIYHQTNLTQIGALKIEQLSAPQCQILNQPKYLQKYHYGFIDQTFSKTRGEVCLTNTCFYCEAFLNTIEKHHKYDSNIVIWSEYIEIKLDQDNQYHGLWYLLKLEDSKIKT